MSHHLFYVVLWGAGIASSQTVSPELQKYLGLSDVQAQSINGLNSQFSTYVGTQETAFYQLQGQALAELGQKSPDAGVVGNAYAQMAMIQRDYVAQLAQLQSQVGALLTSDQVALVGALLNVERLQPLESEAQCADVEGPSFSFVDFLVGAACHVPPIGTALTLYLNLTDAQVAAIENLILGNQDYMSRQSLKIQELQNQIADLTAAQMIDAATLGADYIAISQIQADETTQTNQLTTAVRSVLTDQQQPQLQALDNALQLGGTASEAVDTNILVLPPDLQSSPNCNPLTAPPFPQVPCAMEWFNTTASTTNSRVYPFGKTF